MSSLVLSGGFWSTVGDWIANIFITLGLLIDNVVYVFINWMYRVFMLVAKVDIFGGGAEIEAITKRIYIIVGVAMLFIFAYNLVLLIINPEGKQLGNMKKVIQNAIISIILITLLPLIFSYLTTIQNHILESNVIGQIILGTSTEEELENKNKKAGVKTSLDIFSAFYHPEGQSLNSCRSNPSANELCARYVDAYDLALQNDDVSSFIWDDTLKAGLKEGTMEYTWIISTIAGVFALWCFVSFALDIGIRVGKMAFYEIISPVPVMMRILPNDKMFDKWFKGITNTYVSLFVRLAIIYFCVYAITLVPDILTNMWAASGDSGILVMLANVVVILGILKFAQEAPKLLSDLFGGSGNIKFGIGSKVKDNKLAMAGMGAVGGAFGGMVGNAYNSFKNNKGLRKAGAIPSAFGGLVGGARRGAVSGYKSSTFKGLGESITQSKLDTATAKSDRAFKHEANRRAGAINGKEIPVISTALGGLKTTTKDGLDSVVTWITGEGGSSPRGQAINKAKSANSAIKGDSYSKGKGITSNDELQQMINVIRQGSSIEFNSKSYGGGKDITQSISDLRADVKKSNKEQQIKNYKDKAYMLEGHLKQFKDVLNDSRGVFGSNVESVLAEKLQKAADGCKNDDLKPLLQEFVSGGKVQWGKIDSMLSMDMKQIQDSSDAQRMALAEFSDIFDTVMTQAAVRNVVDEKKDKK